jgi:hypothetical protein
MNLPHTPTPELVVRRPRPHPGQRRILDQADRFNVVRCGRRFGKSTIGVLETIDALVRGRPVGWFAARYDLFLLVWEELLGRLRPLIVAKQENHKSFKVAGGGTFKGWSLDADDPGRSAHYGLVVLDECGLVPHLGRVWRTSIRPTMLDHEASRAWFLGTPRVSGPEFNALFDLGLRGEPGWRSFTGRTQENPHLPGIEAELSQARQQMAEWEYLQEYEGIPAEGDTSFFSARVVEQHRACYAREPLWIGDVRCAWDSIFDREAVARERRADRVRWVDDPSGRWRWWRGWEGSRPSQDDRYVMGVDLGYGVGASNTVFSVASADTREKIAEFVSPAVTPEEAALLAALTGVWLGGRGRCALVCPESNGPGEVFIKHLRRLNYPGLYRERTAPSDTDPATVQRYGWRSGATAKEILLGDYRAALAGGRFTNPSHRALDECLTYRVDEKGRVVSQYDFGGDSGEAARVPHGDRVVADALCWLACQEAARAPLPKLVAAPGTLAYLLEKRERERQDRSSSW